MIHWIPLARSKDAKAFLMYGRFLAVDSQPEFTVYVLQYNPDTRSAKTWPWPYKGLQCNQVRTRNRNNQTHGRWSTLSMGSDCAWIASIAVECSSSRFFPVESASILLRAARRAAAVDVEDLEGLLPFSSASSLAAWSINKIYKVVHLLWDLVLVVLHVTACCHVAQP